MHLDRPVGASKENRKILCFTIKCIPLICPKSYSEFQFTFYLAFFSIHIYLHEMKTDPEKGVSKRCIWPCRWDPAGKVATWVPTSTVWPAACFSSGDGWESSKEARIQLCTIGGQDIHKDQNKLSQSCAKSND